MSRRTSRNKLNSIDPSNLISQKYYDDTNHLESAQSKRDKKLNLYFLNRTLTPQSQQINTYNITPSKQYVARIKTGGYLSSFRWSNHTKNRNNNEKSRYQDQVQQIIQNERKVQYQTEQKRHNLEQQIAQLDIQPVTVSKNVKAIIKHSDILSQLQPLMTMREIKQARNLRRKNNPQSNYNIIKESMLQPVQFSYRKHRPDMIKTIQTNPINIERIYIFKSQDQFMKKILDTMQWKQSKNKNGYSYSLKWTDADTPMDYTTVRQGQYFNHIRGCDQLSNKGKLAINLMGNNLNRQDFQQINNQIKIGSFFPKSYDLNTNFYQFSIQFNHSGMLSLLKKYVEHFKTKIYSIFQSPKKVQLGQLLKSKKFLSKSYDQNFTLNVPLLISLSFYLQSLKQKYKINYFQDQIFVDLDLTLDSRIVETLLAYLKIPIQQKALLKKPLDDKILQNHILQAKYETPSDELISLLIHYYRMFKSKFPSFLSEGIRNIWILKPLSTSKGQQIEIITKLQQNSSRFRNKVAQKYIEDCLVFKGVNKQNLAWKYVEGRKFNIRQWVLVTAEPFRIFKYSTCHLRFGWEIYNIQKIKQKKATQNNNSNASIKSNLFQTSSQWAVLPLQELYSYLMNMYSADIEQSFHSQMDNIIITSITSIIEKLDLKKNCFQIFCFDVLMDSMYKLWLIDINSTPNCQSRNPWLKQLSYFMGKDLLKKVLPHEYLSKLKENKESKHHFQLIYQDGQLCYYVPVSTQEFGFIKVRQKARAQKNLFGMFVEYMKVFRGQLIKAIGQCKPIEENKLKKFNIKNINNLKNSLDWLIREKRLKEIWKILKIRYSNLYTQGDSVQLIVMKQLINNNEQEVEKSEQISLRKTILNEKKQQKQGDINQYYIKYFGALNK